MYGGVATVYLDGEPVSPIDTRTTNITSECEYATVSTVSNNRTGLHNMTVVNSGGATNGSVWLLVQSFG